MENSTVDLINQMTRRENQKTRELERALERIKMLEAAMQEASETLLMMVDKGSYTHAQKNGAIMVIAQRLEDKRTSFSFASFADDYVPF